MQISEAESVVMEVLWASSPRAAEDVIAALAGRQDWQEATIKTLLNRLLNKGAIAADRDGRRYLYRPLLQREDWVLAESRGLLERLFDGRVAPLVAHFSAQRELGRKDIAELRKLLEEIDAKVPREPGVEIHLVLDNYATHKTPAVKRWFPRHPEYRLHLTPTSGSWLNLVERSFAEITEKRIRRGVSRSVAALEAAIREYLEHHTASPKPFVWTADADSILNRIKRVCERTSDSGH